MIKWSTIFLLVGIGTKQMARTTPTVVQSTRIALKNDQSTDDIDRGVELTPEKRRNYET